MNVLGKINGGGDAPSMQLSPVQCRTLLFPRETLRKFSAHAKAGGLVKRKII